jgi:signal transduction histidine kinase
MIEFDMLKVIGNYGKNFHNLGVAALIMGTEFQIISSNLYARRDYPFLASPEGMPRLAMNYGTDKLLAMLGEDGVIFFSELVAYEDTRIVLVPIYHDARIAAVAALFVGNDSIIEHGALHQKSLSADIISSGIRTSVDSIFQSLDALILKSDVLGVNWVAPHVNQIAQQGYQTLRIAANVTEYVRLQNGEMLLTPATCNLSAWLEEIRDALEGMAKNCGIPLHVMIPHEDCLVSLDISHFESAFFNVLHNAFYYTKAGNEVFVALRLIPGGASITIQDKGLGIPPDALESVTNPFYSYSHGMSIGGAGLGLTIAQRVVHAHNGELSITSESGEGTEVVITLPAKTFSGILPLAQYEPDYQIPRNRFSMLYIGLAGIATSPY